MPDLVFPTRWRQSLGRFYPIIDSGRLSGQDAVRLARTLGRAGCTMFQVRAKGETSRSFFLFARDVISAAGRGVRMIINDRFDIALGLGAAGVHLGEHDLPVEQVRKLVPDGFIIGATARDPASAAGAETQGADYLGTGAVFPTDSKQDTRLIGLEGLSKVAEAVRVPVYAIAGITLENCARTIDAGAWGCAGITVLSGSDDPAETFRRLEHELERAARELSNH
ncbi:MAG: thiamine phosphate synthase [Gemmatimonadota bacterium]|nr:thiamine phosphate synthase [Gemmatimonadota bacterium]